ncbi:putative ostreolysin [Botrytis fragariae]|uniref:Putative ostreolysin n=1 Tax=Botrytis fragariae TaxID=1964551 RepID=A0A8H6EI40_9HELO|nr:putative ostreolysin [Botrytis fragariae]KAF5873063.1 putative ostreolysin [Botrytis fragariae]
MSGINSSVVINVNNTMMGGFLEFKNAELKQGKFHEDGKKDVEISAADVNKKVAPPHTAIDICASSSSTGKGLEGSIELYDRETKICRLSWNDPASGDNDFQVHGFELGGRYLVLAEGWNRSGGSLGRVNVKVMKNGF